DKAGNPLGAEFLVNTTTAGDQQFASVAAGSNGSFVVTWSSQGQDGSGWGVYARRYDKAGNPLGGELLVNTTTTGDQQFAAVAAGSNGDFIVAWSSQGQDGSGWGVF